MAKKKRNREKHLEAALADSALAIHAASLVVTLLNEALRESHHNYVESYRDAHHCIRILRDTALAGDDITEELVRLERTMGDLIAQLEEQVVTQ